MKNESTGLDRLFDFMSVNFDKLREGFRKFLEKGASKSLAEQQYAGDQALFMEELTRDLIGNLVGMFLLVLVVTCFFSLIFSGVLISAKILMFSGVVGSFLAIMVSIYQYRKAYRNT